MIDRPKRVWLQIHLSTAVILMLLAAAGLGAGIWCYTYFRFRETANSKPIEKLANRILEDAYLQGGSEIRLIKRGPEIHVYYRIRDSLEEQMTLPASAYDGLLRRYTELCDGSDQIDYARCKPEYPLHFKLELPTTPDSQELILLLLETTKRK